MNDKTTIRFRQLEFFGLISLGFSLPIMEAPKHFAIAFLFIGALGWRLAQKPKVWRKPDTVEWILFAMWSVSLASTVANWPLLKGIHGFKDTSCILFLFWAMYRSNYSTSQIKKLLYAMIGAVIIGLFEGLWEWKSGLRPQLEFHSAGVVTQSSIYLGISIVLMLGVVFDTESQFNNLFRTISVGCILFSLPCLVLMGSRGTLLGFIITAGLLTMVFFHNKKFRTIMAISSALTAGLISVLLITNENSAAAIRIKHLASNINGSVFQNTENDLIRLENWKIGLAQATQGGHPWLGIGPRNYPIINIDKLRFNKPLTTYPSIWQDLNHAHNLFLTKLCEEGILGLAAFVAFLIYVAIKLFHFRPRADSSIHWSWIAAVGALIMPIVAGSFNSSFTNEFAWLSMLLMGFAMGRLRLISSNSGKNVSSKFV